MGYRIGIKTYWGTRRVTGYRTSNPNIWVTKTSSEEQGFALTHRPSGKSVVGYLASLEMADLAWSVVKQFPVDWSEKDPDMGKFSPVLKAIHDSFKRVVA